jgi:hypothetical protein
VETMRREMRRKKKLPEKNEFREVRKKSMV